MLGVTAKKIEKVYSVARKVDVPFTPDVPGLWGGLFFCCGAVAMTSEKWQQIVADSSVIINSGDLNLAIMGIQVKSSDDCVFELAEFIQSCFYDPAVEAEAKKWLEQLGSKIKTQAGYDCYYQWCLLAVLLNNMKNDSFLDFFKLSNEGWIDMFTSEPYFFNWPEVLFAAGMKMASDDTVDWQKMVSATYMLNRLLKKDLDELFNYFSGQSDFTLVKKTASYKDLKKGVRLKLKSGWMAVVVKKNAGDDNTIVAEVVGDFTETGNIYIDTIDEVLVGGEWLSFEMSEAQRQFSEDKGLFFGRKT